MNYIKHYTYIWNIFIIIQYSYRLNGIHFSKQVGKYFINIVKIHKLNAVSFKIFQWLNVIFVYLGYGFW